MNRKLKLGLKVAVFIVVIVAAIYTADKIRHYIRYSRIPCGESSISTESAPSRKTHCVMVYDNSFEEIASGWRSPNITVERGDTVVWINKGSTAHTITGDYSWLSSPEIKPGDTFSYTFNDVGKISYHCSTHLYVKGSILIVPDPYEKK